MIKITKKSNLSKIKLCKDDVYIDGDVWTNLVYGTLLDPNGVRVYISGNIIFVNSKKDVPPGGLWMPRAANHRYSIVNKRITKGTSLPEKIKNITIYCNN